MTTTLHSDFTTTQLDIKQLKDLLQLQETIVQVSEKGIVGWNSFIIFVRIAQKKSKWKVIQYKLCIVQGNAEKFLAQARTP